MRKKMKKTMLVTGSSGLIGSEATRHWLLNGYHVIGIDNDYRSIFFGKEASTKEVAHQLSKEFPNSYTHLSIDIQNHEEIRRVIQSSSKNLSGVLHAAAQPSHDWAANDPMLDFSINALSTLNLLESMRSYAPEVPFVFLSTNKVYGDSPNSLPLEKVGNRLDLPPGHVYYDGIDESMSIDNCLHSVFGASKLAADVLVQEYGRYFNLPTLALRGGTLSGENHAAVPLHGFLAYLTKCAINKKPYEIIGYSGFQVRDVIHAKDVISLVDMYIQNPKSCGVSANIGGGRSNSVSVLEALDLVGDIVGTPIETSINNNARSGDHRWWISSNRLLNNFYPDWEITISVTDIVERIVSRSRS
jgi:CDP-paratose 2-epimerase